MEEEEEGNEQMVKKEGKIRCNVHDGMDAWCASPNQVGMTIRISRGRSCRSQLDELQFVYCRKKLKYELRGRSFPICRQTVITDVPSPATVPVDLGQRHNPMVGPFTIVRGEEDSYQCRSSILGQVVRMLCNKSLNVSGLLESGQPTGGVSKENMGCKRRRSKASGGNTGRQICQKESADVTLSVAR